LIMKVIIMFFPRTTTLEMIIFLEETSMYYIIIGIDDMKVV
jgi:hypothetical protein